MGSAERTRRCAVCQAVYRGAESFCPIDGGAIVDRVETGDDPYVGRTIDGRYLVHRRIGRGGMGVVYEATHTGLDKRIALKFLLGAASDADALARFRREARVASKIDHDNVVNILDVGRDESGVDYLAMELVDGRDLQAVLRETGQLEPRRAVEVVRQILRGLGAIHAAGIVHRDLKPSNVIVVGDVVKIMDFGISKSMTSATAENITETGNVIGTPQYMSPEQLLGDAIDSRSDLFAVGLILFAVLAGEPPFGGNTMSKLAAMHATQDVPSIATRRGDLPPALVEIVAKAVARRADDRYPTAGDFERALGAIDFSTAPADPGERWMLRTAEASPAKEATKRETATKPETATRPETPAKLETPTQRGRAPTAPQPAGNRGRWIVAAIVVVAVAIGGVLYATRSPSRSIVAQTPDAGAGSSTTIAGSGSTIVAGSSTTVAGSGSAPAVAGSGSTIAGSESSVPDQLAVARRADADGKLDLAIALYADIDASSKSPAPDIVFRLGELYERTGKTAQARASFERYLELAPTAVDRDHVRERIARLTTTKPPVVVAKKPAVDTTEPAGPTPRPKKCFCFPGHGSDSSHFRLCVARAKEPALCRCRGPVPGSSSEGFLCPIPGTKCQGYENDPKCYDALHCEDPGWSSKSVYSVSAKRGDPCTGYRHLDTPIQGKYTCAVCDGPAGLVFEGQQGDPCVGYDFMAGARIDGHLNNCW